MRCRAREDRRHGHFGERYDSPRAQRETGAGLWHPPYDDPTGTRGMRDGHACVIAVRIRAWKRMAEVTIIPATPTRPRPLSVLLISLYLYQT